MDDIDQAFKKTNRANFLPDDVRSQAGLDVPLPIGFGQTNSQPSTVRLMLEWLEVEKNQKILDVGSGSGWSSALLACLTGRRGHVYAVEKIPELARMGYENCRRAGILNVHFFVAGKDLGLCQFAPYDRILVSASAAKLPEKLLDQLKPGGKIVVPVRSSILEITKLSDNKKEILTHRGFGFVPLVGAG